jgi:hypothetical protein
MAVLKIYLFIFVGLQDRYARRLGWGFRILQDALNIGHNRKKIGWSFESFTFTTSKPLPLEDGFSLKK